MAKLDSYWLVEYPEHKGLLEQIMGNYKKSIRKDLIREELGETEWMFLSNLQQVRQMVGKPQARIPFALTVH
jgi:protease-4